MDFVLLLLINIAILALIYLALRHQLQKNYNSDRFLETLQKEVNGIMTDLNRTAEMNVQILNNEAEKLQSLKEKVEKRIAEMQQIFAILDRADGRYNEILARAQKKVSVQPKKPPPAPEKQTRSPSPRDQVLGLYNQGRAVQEISTLTHLPIGEVELIIELSKQRDGKQQNAGS